MPLGGHPPTPCPSSIPHTYRPTTHLEPQHLALTRALPRLVSPNESASTSTNILPRNAWCPPRATSYRSNEPAGNLTSKRSTNRAPLQRSNPPESLNKNPTERAHTRSAHPCIQAPLAQPRHRALKPLAGTALDGNDPSRYYQHPSRRLIPTKRPSQEPERRNACTQKSSERNAQGHRNNSSCHRR